MKFSTLDLTAVVDENDTVIGKAKVDQAHSEGLLHREVYVYIIRNNKVLLQKRADTNLWDHSVGGHVTPKEGYIKGAIREAREELGIDVTEEDLKEIAHKRIETIKPNRINKRFVKVFVIEKEFKALNTDKDEVADTRYFSKEEILELILGKNEPVKKACKQLLKEFIVDRLH